MEGLVTQRYIVPKEHIVRAVRALQQAGLAARLDPKRLTGDEADGASLVVVEAHSGDASPSGEFQHELMNRIDEVLGVIAPGYLRHSGGVAINCDESLEDADNLPSPAVLAAEIAEDLEAALAEFTAVAESLGGEAVETA